MRTTKVSIALSCCLLGVSMLAAAQSIRKPGLYEITSKTTWKQSPIAAGKDVPAGTKSIFSGEPHTSQVCLSQEMIDKYGAPMPQSRDCEVQNLVKTDRSMKGDWVCSGRMEGKGTLESASTEDGRSKGKVYFVGTMQMGAEKRPAEFTIESSSIFKGYDCGDVKPLPMPVKPGPKD
jgi:hypothetical protein